MNNIIPFRRPRTLAEMACSQKREAKTAELINEQITMQTLVYFVEELGLQFMVEREFS